MKEEELAIPQFRERMFVDLTTEDDGNEEELRVRTQSESEEDEFSSIESSIENESVVSNMDDDGIKCYHDLLMNSGRSRVVGSRKGCENASGSLDRLQRVQTSHTYSR